MKLIGQMTKMRTNLAEVVEYEMCLDGLRYPLNPLLGERISFNFTGQIKCVECGKTSKKSFGQGFCYSCFISSAQNSPCIINPELCEGHLGNGRDLEFELAHHVQEHIVYLAVASGVKVGVTRTTQMPTRWIDQGASAAIVLAEVPYRQLAGLIEVELKSHLSDKTNWQKMLKNEVLSIDLLEEKERVARLLPEEFQHYISDNDAITTIPYPVLEFPLKVKSINLEKTPSFELKLLGVKGQYLIFEGGNVLNWRNHSGFVVEINA